MTQIEKVEVLLTRWTGRAAILLNAEWAPDTVDSQHTAFARSFESVYSFLPLAIQVKICTSRDMIAAYPLFQH